MGNKDSIVEKVRIPFHILGDVRDSIQEADQENINCYFTMEIVDFTLVEYIRGNSIPGTDKAIIGTGHFNLEEPGTKYMITYPSTAVKTDIPCAHIQSGDMYDCRTRQYREHIQKLYK